MRHFFRKQKPGLKLESFTFNMKNHKTRSNRRIIENFCKTMHPRYLHFHASCNHNHILMVAEPE